MERGCAKRSQLCYALAPPGLLRTASPPRETRRPASLFNPIRLPPPPRGGLGRGNAAESGLSLQAPDESSRPRTAHHHPPHDCGNASPGSLVRQAMRCVAHHAPQPPRRVPGAAPNFTCRADAFFQTLLQKLATRFARLNTAPSRCERAQFFGNPAPSTRHRPSSKSRRRAQPALVVVAGLCEASVRQTPGSQTPATRLGSVASPLTISPHLNTPYEFCRQKRVPRQDDTATDRDGKVVRRCRRLAQIVEVSSAR